MKKIIIMFLFLHSLGFAYSHEEIISDYKAKKYNDVCSKSAVLFKGVENDEAILSIIGDACARVDSINPLGHIVRKLVSTPAYRANASYFATIILQKKLIYQFMNDDIDLKNLRLPKSEHILSIIFENLVQNNYVQIDKESKKLKIITDTKEYIIWLSNDEKRVVHVDEYINGMNVARHSYL